MLGAYIKLLLIKVFCIFLFLSDILLFLFDKDEIKIDLLGIILIFLLSFGQSLDDTEFLNIESHTPDEIEEMIQNGKFQQAMHIAAWLLATRKSRQKQ